jgi:hypothetical protein
MGLVGETTGLGDIAETAVAREHKTLGMKDASFENVLMRRAANLRFENAREVRFTEPCRFRELCESHAVFQIVFYQRK